MPGCLSYLIAKDQANDDGIWITEVWNDKASHAPAGAKVYVGLAPLAKTRKDMAPAFKHLSQSDRTAIREILLDTKPDFAVARPKDA